MKPGLTGCREDFEFYTLCSKRLFFFNLSRDIHDLACTFKTPSIAYTMGWYNRATAEDELTVAEV